ncbi:MAG: hypothetical protein KGI80_03885 [Verrucomicrobiota bacterium]|nr:hypothetical protein [Verrucomicrobiota bacterium]
MLFSIVCALLVCGALIDEQDRKVLARSHPRTLERMERGDPLTLSDVIHLSQLGVADETIMDYLKHIGSIYQLTEMQVRRLQEAGVSERIIQFMAK